MFFLVFVSTFFFFFSSSLPFPLPGDEHTNIMGQLECCTDEENIYSVMKFCKGE
jgi:hypothetical protein